MLEFLVRKATLLAPLLAGAAVLASACELQTVAAAKEAPAPDLGAGMLVPTGAMDSARACHSATTLLDGRVLLAGGMAGGEGTAAGSEIYDPARGAFIRAGPMRALRQSHTATRLADGRVLITGGYGAENEYLRSTELFDPATDTFASAGEMASARAGHLAVPMQDGRVLLIGGVGPGWTFLSSAEIYDPRARTFTPTGAMSVPRESHAAVRLDDGRVLVVGGHQGRRAAIELYASAEIYDPRTGAFTAAGEMNVRRHKHDAVLLADGQVLVTGGSDEQDSRGVHASAELYDPRTATFKLAGALRMGRYKHQGTSLVLPDGRVLLPGGTTRAEVYDPRAGTFTLVGGEGRLAGQFSASALLSDGRVLIAGGYGDNRGPQSGAWLYQP